MIKRCAVESNNVSDDLRFLPHLTVCVTNLGMGDVSFLGYFKVEMLKRFWITAGKYFVRRRYSSLGWSKVLEVESLQNDLLSMEVFKSFLKVVEYLRIEGEMMGIFNLFPQLEDTGFQNIRILQIVNSENIECLIDTRGTGQGLPSLTTVNIFPILKKLSLRHLMQLEKMCYGQPPLSCLGQLRCLAIDICPRLKNIVPDMLPGGGELLEELAIRSCHAMNYVYDVEAEATPYRMSLLPSPTTIHLSKLENIRSIWKGPPYKLKWKEPVDEEGEVGSSTTFVKAILRSLESLVTLKIKHCAEMEEIFPLLDFDNRKCDGLLSKLVELHLIELPKLKSIWPNYHWLLHRLEVIYVDKCDNLTTLFTSAVAKSLVKLQKLQIVDCKALETIIVPDADSCEALTGMQDSFKEIKIIEIFSCNNLKSVLPISFITHGLPKLERLHIHKCANLEQVFVDEKGIVSKTAIIELKDLQYLKHWNLPRLVSLVPFNWHPKISFLSEQSRNLRKQLKEMQVGDMPNLEIVNSIVTRPLLEKMVLTQVGCFSSIFPPDHVLSCQSFVVQPTKVTIENCKTDVDYTDERRRYCTFTLPNITTLCQLVDLSQLRHITVRNTVTLSKNLFPHHVAQALGSLEILEVYNCNELEILIEPAGDVQLPYFPNLQGLILNHLSNLAYIWKGTMELINLSHLEYVRLYNCDRLTSLFTSTLAKSLVKLEELQIIHCKALETIIARDDKSCEASTGTQDSFKEMKIIRVEFCDNLKSMLPISFVAHGLPKLESFSITDCDNLEQVFEDEEGIVAKTAIIEWKNLDSLVLWNLPKLVRLVPFNWHLKIISSLSEFAVSLKYQEGPWMMDIETCSVHLEEALLDVKEAQQQVLTQLKKMHVGDMLHLKHLCKGHTHFVNLCNLAEIYVYNCASIKNLFPLSVAQNLQNLRSLEVVNCSSLEQIFDDDIRSEGRQSTNFDDDDTRPLLEIMVLKEVGCFSSIFPPPDHVLSCQSFVVEPNKVTIENYKTDVDYFYKCGSVILPNITTLCQLVKLSQLRHITVKNMVTLSKSLFPHHVAQALGCLEILEVVNCNELENLVEPARDQDSTQLHEKTSATCFPCLVFLSVYQCDKLKTVFPLSAALSLPKLRYISLCTAHELEEIFTDDLNEEYVSGCNKLIKLPELTNLHFSQLPRLSRMCPAGYALCCPNPPKDLIIDECPFMDADKCFPPIYSKNVRQCAI
ncbi:hypothetical protein BVRB_4g088050 [Beta vulgaris subsp. vulgaris]|nr:hypothetical protein BVRB_4g088050 [Beta vulgaris subsp. vulgaris]